MTRGDGMAGGTKRVATGAAAAAAGLIGLAYATAFLPGGAPAWAPWALAVGTAGLMVALMALGASRAGRPLGAMAWALAFTFAVVAGGLGLALALPAEGAGSALWLGLPPRAAVVLYGVGLLPTLVLPLAYALTFDRLTLTEEDVARVRALAAGAGASPRARDATGAAGERHRSDAARTDSVQGGPPGGNDDVVAAPYRHQNAADATPAVRSRS